MEDRFGLRCSFVRACGLTLLPALHTTHIVRSVTRASFPPKFFSCRQLPALRDPSARNLGQTMWRCVQHRCFTVTLTANPHLRARAGSQCASSQASSMPTPPLRLTRNKPAQFQPQDEITRLAPVTIIPFVCLELFQSYQAASQMSAGSQLLQPRNQIHQIAIDP
jgi:hypothetical protein